MEADFLREYGLRLSREIDHMSWREFRILLSNLSPDCALKTRLRTLRPAAPTGAAAADRFWSRMASLR